MVLKVLITSGGTRIPIDSVRHIGNMSNGTFPSRIAEECLKANMQVNFFKAKHSLSPFETSFLSSDKCLCVKNLIRENTKTQIVARSYQDQLTEKHFVTFEDYAKGLKEWIESDMPDVIILAAAVSDYLVKDPVKGKIRSKNSLTIKLTPAPKIISGVRGWAPHSILIGFKLLVDSTEEELKEASFASLKKNRCNFVVANDLAEIKDNNHRIHFASLDSSGGKIWETHTRVSDPNYLAWQVMNLFRRNAFNP